MTKNISVTDQNGNKIGSTYPKRALGLVKKDRARWINTDTICLCARNMEEKTMADNLYEVFDNQISKMQEQLRDNEPETAMQVRIQILKTMEVFKAQEQGAKVIDMISKQLDSMQTAMNQEMPTAENAAARETTRQKMLDILEKFTQNNNSDTVYTDNIANN